MKPIQRLHALFAALALFQLGCSSGSGSDTSGSGNASGGQSASGGASSSSTQATGGASSSSTQATGGASSSSTQATGGASSSSTRAAGGASSSSALASGGTSTSSAPTAGGTSSSGSVVVKGGTTGSGGSGTVTSGGRANTGGRTGTGATGPGGRVGTGGTTASTRTTASAGAPGGTTSSTSTPSSDPVPSPGCSATPTTTSPCTNTASSGCKIDVKGTTREYYLNLPTGYDGKTPVPVVWEYHPWGGTGKQGMTMYQLNSKLTNVIFVSPHGTGDPIGFPNTNGMDEDMTRAINAEIEAKYCIDKSRYFATGFSYGGSMSFTAACNMSDIFRAIGAQSGSTVSGATCARKTPARMVAIWATHGDADTTLPIGNTTPMIDALVKNNGCTTTTAAVTPSPCVEYQGCKAGYPVVWCVRPGDGHAMANFAPDAITKFFKQFF
ncbi:MAG TPA: prolyl oligopeptidase family serine peptidase [Polyangiaceae bacterium]